MTPEKTLAEQFREAFQKFHTKGSKPLGRAKLAILCEDNESAILAALSDSERREQELASLRADAERMRGENITLRSDKAGMQGELDFCRSFAEAIKKHASEASINLAIADALAALAGDQQGGD